MREPPRYGSSQGLSPLAKTAGMLAAQGASKGSDDDDDDDDEATGFGDEKVVWALYKNPFQL